MEFKDMSMVGRPDVGWVYVAHANVILVNKSADPDAKIIWLIRRSYEYFPAPVKFSDRRCAISRARTV